MRVLVILCSICCFLQGTNTLNIVSIGTLATSSHFIWKNALLDELLSRGHKISELTFKEPAAHPNRTSFVLESGLFSDDKFMAFINDTKKGKHFLQGIHGLFQFNIGAFQENVASKAFQGFKKHLVAMKEKVDVLLVDNTHREVMLGVSQLIGYPPIVTMTAFNHPVAINTQMGNPRLPALIPLEESPYSCEMSFPQRVVNLIAYLYFRFNELAFFDPAMDQLLQEYVSRDSPSLRELEQNVSIALVNTHPTTHCQQATTASIVEVGFLHVKPPKSLPKDLQKYLDEAENGVIVVSFGSMIRPDIIPDLQDTLVEVFKKFKQRILWKTPNPPKTLPPNVLASNWLPQSDVLAHPKVRLIVTHGGTLSMQEAVYRGVPIIMVPFFLDQKGTANRIASRGVGRKLDFNQLTVEGLTQQINAILNDPTYKQKMSRLSAIAQDQPESALQRAVFWVEFVGRHGHAGTQHLRKDIRHISLIQYYSIDVIASLTYGVATLIFVITKVCTMCLCGSQRKMKAE